MSKVRNILTDIKIEQRGPDKALTSRSLAMSRSFTSLEVWAVINPLGMARWDNVPWALQGLHASIIVRHGR